MIAESYDLILDLDIKFSDSCSSSEVYSALCGVISKWGESSVSSINELLWDLKQDVVSTVVNNSSTQLKTLLRSSNFISVNDSHNYVSNIENYESEFKAAVSQIASSYTHIENKQSKEVFFKLWSIERSVRYLVREALIAKFGWNQWKEKMFDNYKSNGEAVIESIIKSNSNYSSQPYNSISEISDPLEWLTFSELFILIEKNEIDIGIGKNILNLFDEKLRPIRNKVAHMRIISEADIQTVNNYYTLLNVN